MRALIRTIGVALALMTVTVALPATASATGQGAAATYSRIANGNACLTMTQSTTVSMLPCLPVYGDGARWERVGYVLRNVKTRQCLLTGGTTTASTCLVPAHRRQEWTQTAEGQIKPLAGSGLCLTHRDDRYVESLPCTGAATQKWAFNFD
ncbi:RICIN domain-containing protein [Crossiella sp. SN42]|uniref:ricin-type beta-trefoil lectin domain protein n=1 Tax=Crossiella sp. SN42 TaxID=2944808 RepID=UPI00207C6924|nr:ricin-type beta-trefoil lectin domain protein [Crossiella sp. SN42]MCO1574733.1 RICIN domain-containing protein [Crossiella sp. SN42]